jgi:hypothetical protein
MWVIPAHPPLPRVLLRVAPGVPLGLVEAAAYFCPLCGAPTPQGLCPVHQVPGVAQGPALAPFMAPGVVLGGRYRIDHVLLAQGAQGTFLGTALADGRTVVVESFASERLARRARLLDSLVRRPEVAAQFMRPELAPILDFGVEPARQTPFLVMAFDPARGPQGVLTPDGVERRTAATFLRTCLSVLDQHDREFLEPLGAMPTQVPYTAIPTAAAPAPPPLQRAPRRKKRRDGPYRFLGLTGSGWAGVGMLAVVVAYYLTDDESQYSPYYNPRITEPTRMGWGKSGRGEQHERTPLEDLAQQGGDVEIASNPSGAEVWYGGRMMGETPTSVPRPVGRDRVVLVLRHDGYLDKQVTLHAGSMGVTLRMIPVNGREGPAGLVGEQERYDPMRSRFEKSPFSKSPFDESPMTKSPFTNPFGSPGGRGPGQAEEEQDEDDGDGP